jgi:serine/threonine protein kinase/Tfp pilus assembly protein PilF
MTTQLTEPLTANDALAEVIDEFQVRLAQVGPTGAETLLAEYPAHADRLRRILPAMLTLAAFTESLGGAALGSLDTAEPLGDFLLLRAIGRGGMGVVYEAKQLSLGRRVAVKILPMAAVLDERQLQRFKHEASAAAMLKHPHIVSVYSIGCERGVHFYAMELIDGQTLAQLVETRRLEPGARSPACNADTVRALHDSTARPADFFAAVARLGVQAAEGLEHAHLHGIVHRDIKPSNLMVDARGHLWVTDFGLAHIETAPNLTLTGDVMGTLRYMSPEQAAGRPTMIDHRTDIYSLGATMYELATGRPVVAGEERAAILREIAETDPAPPRKHTSAMPADLETILLKCLAKEPSARYDSAQALADDLRRFLEQKPVVARRPSRWDMLIKVALRHRALTAAMTLLLLALTAGVIGTTWGMLRARSAEAEATKLQIIASGEREEALQQQAIAEEEAAISKAVNEFLREDLLAQASPAINPRDRQVTVEELLHRASTRIDGKFTDQPRVEAAIRQSIGDAYFALQNFSAAQPHFERAWKIREELLGENHLDTLIAISQLAEVYRLQGNLSQAEALATQLLERCRILYGEGHPETCSAMNNLAAIYFDQHELVKAETLFKSALDATSRILGDEDPATIEQMNNLAMLYRSQGKFAEAEPLFVESLAFQRRTLGEEHPNTLLAMSNLGALYKDQGRFAEAERLFTQTLDAGRRVMGEDTPGMITLLNNLGSLHQAQRQLDKAAVCYEEAIEKARAIGWEAHPNTLTTMKSLAMVYAVLGRFNESDALHRDALEICRTNDGHQSMSSAGHLSNWGNSLLNRKEYLQAEPLLREALAIHEQIMPEDWMTFYVKSLLGEALLGQQRFEEAEPLLLDGYAGVKSRESTMPASNRGLIVSAAKRLVALYAAWGKPEEAEKWLTELAAQQRQLMNETAP